MPQRPSPHLKIASDPEEPHPSPPVVAMIIPAGDASVFETFFRQLPVSLGISYLIMEDHGSWKGRRSCHCVCPCRMACLKKIVYICFLREARSSWSGEGLFSRGPSRMAGLITSPICSWHPSAPDAPDAVQPSCFPIWPPVSCRVFGWSGTKEVLQ